MSNTDCIELTLSCVSDDRALTPSRKKNSNAPEKWKMIIISSPRQFVLFSFGGCDVPWFGRVLYFLHARMVCEVEWAEPKGLVLAGHGAQPPAPKLPFPIHLPQKGKIRVLPTPTITHNAHQPSCLLCSAFLSSPSYHLSDMVFNFLCMIHTVLCLPAPNCKLHESRHPLIGNRGPQPQHRQHFGLDNSLLWEAVLCIIGHIEGSIPDLHQQDASSTPHPTCNS